MTKSPLANDANNKLLRWYSFFYVFMSLMTFLLVIFADIVEPYTLSLFGYVLMFAEMCIIGVLVTMTVTDFMSKRKEKQEIARQRLLDQQASKNKTVNEEEAKEGEEKNEDNDEADSKPE